MLKKCSTLTNDWPQTSNGILTSKGSQTFLTTGTQTSFGTFLGVEMGVCWHILSCNNIVICWKPHLVRLLVEDIVVFAFNGLCL